MLKDLSPALAATSEPEKAEELPQLRRDASLAVTEAADPELLDVVLLVTSELNEIDGGIIRSGNHIYIEIKQRTKIVVTVAYLIQMEGRHWHTLQIPCSSSSPLDLDRRNR